MMRHRLFFVGVDSQFVVVLVRRWLAYPHKITQSYQYSRLPEISPLTISFPLPHIAPLGVSSSSMSSPAFSAATGSGPLPLGVSLGFSHPLAMPCLSVV